MSPVDKLRLAQLRRRLQAPHPADLLRGDDIATSDALRDLGFSDRAVQRFFRPLVGGIQLDPDLTTSRRMFDVIFRMLADGDSAVPAGGMQAIPDQLADGIPDIRLDTTAVEIRGTDVLTADGTLTATSVVVACEGPAAAGLIGTPDPGSRSVGAVYFDAPEAPTDERLVVLNARSGPVLNAAVMSNVAASYAPPGRHLVVAAMPGIVDGDLGTIARDELRHWWGGQVEDWNEIATYRIRHGQPMQNPPFGPKQAVTVRPGVYVCGDHRDTASIQGALYSGRRTAAAVLDATD